MATLKAKRGVPTDQQIRELLGQYFTMKQQPRESVADFSHRFSEVQHERDSKMRVVAQTTTFRPLLWRANAVDEN